MATGVLSPDSIDLSARSFWEAPAAERERAFAVLRRERPVSWHGPPESVLVDADDSTGGYWAVVRHEDVTAVSRSPEVFCSGQGVMFDDAPAELLEASQSFLAMDAPRHTKVRGLVRAAFTPRQVARISDQIDAHARRIVDDVAPLGECDFVEAVAARLPMMTIWEMFDLPEPEHERLTAAANDLVGWNDPEVMAGREPAAAMLEGVVTLTAAALDLAEERRQRPRRGPDDRPGAGRGRWRAPRRGGDQRVLRAARRGGQRHDAAHHQPRDESAVRVPRPAAAADGRSRRADRDGGRGVRALGDARDDLPPHRHARHRAARAADRGRARRSCSSTSPATATRTRSTHPERFDVLRSPNRHVGFGGGGPHYCLGASLARTQLRAIFTELLTRLPDIEVGEPEPLVGNFINGIKRMPCRFTPA